ncbi:MAG: small-conductance mechanosensitive channel [Candidatus Azotimanducaceae bacterium]|jgi:small conductance mechanosensitive channel
MFLVQPFLPLLITALVLGAGLLLAQYVLITRQPNLGNEARLPRQLVLFALTLISLIVLVVLSPLAESTRNQILGLIGLLVSAVIAVSATAFVTNFMAAIMLRVTRPFAVGDFITVGDHFGKVAERGLFDTEIQTESGELIAIPNAIFISTAVKVITKDGTIISTTLSLGYEINHGRIEALLIRAAKNTGLTDPYVHVVELGDFSVTYRVNGFLNEAKTLLTCRSNLNAAVLDTLHEAGIEIMSPTYARHMQQPLDRAQIPQATRQRSSAETSTVEDVAFSKANLAEAQESLKKEIEAQISELSIEVSEASGDAKSQLQDSLKKLEAKLVAVRLPQNLAGLASNSSAGINKE